MSQESLKSSSLQSEWLTVVYSIMMKSLSMKCRSYRSHWICKKTGALDNIVVYDDGIVKGMMNRKPAPYGSEENGLEICQFYIDPFFQRNGIGRNMLETLFQQAEASQVKDIFLWVLEKNDSARIIL